MKLVFPSIVSFVFLAGGIHSGVLLAQNTAQESSSASGQMPDPPQEKWNTAPNNWRRTPVDISRQTDTVSAEVRAKRNADMQSAFSITPSALPGIKVEFREVGGMAGTQSIWVTAGFEGVHVFAADRDSTELYTEMNMRVIDIIQSPDGYPVSKGSLLDVNLLGGTAKTPDGKIHEFRVERERYSAQPGHTYLLHLLYVPDKGKILPFQRWEIISGKLVPDDEMESYRAEHGRSVLAGKSVEEAEEYIRSVIQRGK